MSESGYLPQHDDLLRALVSRPINFFCAVGEESQSFLTAIDRLWSEMVPFESYLVICREPFQTEAEAVVFAKQQFSEIGEDVEVVRV